MFLSYPNSLLVATTINFAVFYWLSTNIYRPQAPLNISSLPPGSLPHSLHVQGRKSWCLVKEQLVPKLSLWVSALIQNTEPSTKNSSESTQGKDVTKAAGLVHSQETAQPQRLLGAVPGKMAIVICGRSRT